MTRRLAVLLSLWAVPAFAAEPATAPPPTPDLAKIVADLKAVTDRLDRLDASVNRFIEFQSLAGEMSRMKLQIEAVQRDVDAVKGRTGGEVTTARKMETPPLNQTPLNDPVTALQAAMAERFDRLEASMARTAKRQGDDLAELRTRVDELRRDVDALRSRPAAQVETFRMPTTPLGTGTIVMRNLHVTPMEVVINNFRYVIPPMSEQRLTMAAGPFTIQVPQTQAFANSRVLAPNGTFTVTNQ